MLCLRSRTVSTDSACFFVQPLDQYSRGYGEEYFKRAADDAAEPKQNERHGYDTRQTKQERPVSFCVLPVQTPYHKKQAENQADCGAEGKDHMQEGMEGKLLRQVGRGDGEGKKQQRQRS